MLRLRRGSIAERWFRTRSIFGWQVYLLPLPANAWFAGEFKANSRGGLDLYSAADQKVSRIGRLPFQIARIGSIGRFSVSRDGRWALGDKTDRWESDIMLVDNFR
jgi:hypothetical protein